MADEKHAAVFTWLTSGTGLVLAMKYGWIAGALVCVTGWVLNSWYDPHVDCWFCKSRAKRRSRRGTGKTFHFCAWPRWMGGCNGSSRRLRFLPWAIGHGFGLGRL